MDSQSILIIILSIMCILGMIYINKIPNREPFSEGCQHTPNADESDFTCMTRCINAMDTNNCEAQECLTKCGQTENSCEVRDPTTNDLLYTTCEINAQTDIVGNTIEGCIRNCARADVTCSGCSEFTIRDPKTQRRITGTYTNNLNDYQTKCDSQIVNHRFCSPCVEACYLCNNPNKCKWLASDEERESLRDLFITTTFTIGVIPDDSKAVIVWKELLDTSAISRYEILIYRKDETNVNSNNEQKTPLIVRRETKQPTGRDQTFEVRGLSNGVTYSINVNKISRDNTSIVPSNTVDVVPSKVNLINFSSINNERTQRQKDPLSVDILKDLTGKSFDITV